MWRDWGSSKPHVTMLQLGDPGTKHTSDRNVHSDTPYCKANLEQASIDGRRRHIPNPDSHASTDRDPAAAGHNAYERPGHPRS